MAFPAFPNDISFPALPGANGIDEASTLWVLAATLMAGSLSALPTDITFSALAL
jgi:hypothetical protein